MKVCDYPVLLVRGDFGWRIGLELHPGDSESVERFPRQRQLRRGSVIPRVAPIAGNVGSQQWRGEFFGPEVAGPTVVQGAVERGEKFRSLLRVDFNGQPSLPFHLVIRRLWLCVP